MAEIVESQEEVVEGAVDITQETQQEVVEQPQEEVVQEQVQEDSIPTKYRGKSLDEIIKMHQEAEKIGLIKIDALGLKTLSVINDTIKIIKEREGTDIDLLTIDTNDPKVYQMLSEGYTKGVFQCEATPYTNLLIKTLQLTYIRE